MERGIPNITVYTFEVPDGQHMRYPDAELWTLDYNEADSYAAEQGYMLIANDYTESDAGSELVEDYTPVPRCAHCGAELTESDDDIWEDKTDANASLDTFKARWCDESPDHLHHPDES